MDADDEVMALGILLHALRDMGHVSSQIPSFEP